LEQALTIVRPLAPFLPERLGAAHRLAAEHWLGRSSETAPRSTNQDAQELPFQRWYRFKEAFAPRAVVDAIASLNHRPATCMDPFGGSGTTALTCQFLGIRPTTVEVNPFLADLIEAKLSRYDVTALMADYRTTLDRAWALRPDPAQIMVGVPPTFLEPGVNGRWIFSIEVGSQILAFRLAIDALPDGKHARLLRVLLGSVLISCSNVIISGKGRRYRSGWSKRFVNRHDVGRLFERAFLAAVEDICRYGPRPCGDYTLLRGDARKVLTDAPACELALFSPPYPNSFDYTDIYNVELWMLGYLRSREDNRALRELTLRSHVQIKRCYAATVNSPLLREVIERLGAKRDQLWDSDIPEMVGAYFHDLATILSGLQHVMRPGASVMMLVGDSRYADISVDVGAISAEVAATLGYRLMELRLMRSMRSSAQQGGRFELGETLVHLTRE
jgi:hypothetical protein